MSKAMILGAILEAFRRTGKWIRFGVGATLLSNTLYTVDVGKRAVFLDRFRGGVVLDYSIGEGTHIIVPWVQKPYIFDIRTRPHTFSSITGTKDLQIVNLTLGFLSSPDVDRLPFIFKTLGLDYEKVLPLISTEVLNAVVAQFNADQLITERPRFYAVVRESLIRRARDFNIVLDDVAITAVEQKQAARLEVERSKYVASKAEATNIRAEGVLAKVISKAASGM